MVQWEPLSVESSLEKYRNMMDTSRNCPSRSPTESFWVPAWPTLDSTRFTSGGNTSVFCSRKLNSKEKVGDSLAVPLLIEMLQTVLFIYFLKKFVCYFKLRCGSEKKKFYTFLAKTLAADIFILNNCWWPIFCSCRIFYHWGFWLFLIYLKWDVHWIVVFFKAIFVKVFQASIFRILWIVTKSEILIILLH